MLFAVRAIVADRFKKEMIFTLSTQLSILWLHGYVASWLKKKYFVTTVIY